MGWGQWVGHLPGNQEDLSAARITQEMGGVLPDATLGGPGLCPLPQTDSALPPCLASFQLPTRDLSSSRSELSSTPFREGGAAPARVCPGLPALLTRPCCSSLLTCMCPGHTCVPDSLPAQH